MTIDQVEKNFEFKVIKKAIRQQFPFIKDLIIDKEDFDKYNTLFVDGVVDLIETYEIKGYKFFPWAVEVPNTKRGFSAIFDISFEEYSKDIDKKIRQIIDMIHFSDVIPEEHKLKRLVVVQDYFAKPVNRSEVRREMMPFGFG